MNESGTGSTYRELSAWASFFVLGGLLAWYGQRVIVDPTSVGRAFALMAAMIVYVVVSAIFFGIVFSIASPNEKDDERDKRIKNGSTRFSGWILGIGVVLAINLIFFQQASWVPIYEAVSSADPASSDAEVREEIIEIGRSVWRHPMVAGHLLVTVFILSEIVRYLTIAVDYRRWS